VLFGVLSLSVIGSCFLLFRQRYEAQTHGDCQDLK